MAYLSELNNIINAATSMLIQNDNICKLVSYYPEKVDLKFNPLAQPKVENPSKLLLDRIYPMPKIPDAETEQICFIDVNIAGGDVGMTNKGFRKIELIFDVICHLDSWIIKGGLRPLKILGEIDGMFNNQLTELPVENKPQPLPFRPKNYSNKFYGYQISYELQINSNIECK